MRYKVEIETRDCGESCPGHFEASVIRGPTFARSATGLATERAGAFKEAADTIRLRYRFAHSFNFTHTPA